MVSTYFQKDPQRTGTWSLWRKIEQWNRSACPKKSGHSAVFHVIILTTGDEGTDTVVSQLFEKLLYRTQWNSNTAAAKATFIFNTQTNWYGCWSTCFFFLTIFPLFLRKQYLKVILDWWSCVFWVCLFVCFFSPERKHHYLNIHYGRHFIAVDVCN